jgi:hypothetical protein
MMTNERRRVQPVDGVAIAGIDDEAVLLHVGTGVYYGIDPVGTRVWQLLVEGADEASIVDQLLREYEVTPERLRADVADFIDMLEENGLVRALHA